MSLPFYTGQIPTADDFNALAVKADLSSSSGASLIGYGATPSRVLIPKEIRYVTCHQKHKQ